MCNLFNDPLNAGHVGYFQVDAYRQRPGCRPPYLLSLFLGFVPRCYCFFKKNILTMFLVSGPLSDMYFFKLVVAKNHTGKVLSVELELNIN